MMRLLNTGDISIAEVPPIRATSAARTFGHRRRATSRM